MLAGRGAAMSDAPTPGSITPAELAALRQYAEIFGASWRRRLLERCASSPFDVSPVLYRLYARNGDKWLRSLDLDTGQARAKKANARRARKARPTPSRSPTSDPWITVACRGCNARVQLRRADVAGDRTLQRVNLTPWAIRDDRPLLPCPFCKARQNYLVWLELEPGPGEPRRCFWESDRAIDGTTPPRARRTTVPERVGCRQCRRQLERRALDAAPAAEIST
jgi:hypothetical protein